METRKVTVVAALALLLAGGAAAGLMGTFGTVTNVFELTAAVEVTDFKEDSNVELENTLDEAIDYDLLAVSIMYEYNDGNETTTETTELSFDDDGEMTSGIHTFEESDFGDDEFPGGDWQEVAVMIDGNEVHSLTEGDN